MIEDRVALVKVAYGSGLNDGCVALREGVLRAPLGLALGPDELADDGVREHFCAVADGDVVGSVSLKPLGRQMAVSEARRGERIGARLFEMAEAWAHDQGFPLIVLNARMSAEGFYAKFGYRSEGGPFEENTIPHIRMTKRLP